MALRPLTVVLSSYNGAKFLPQQIESTPPSWRPLRRAVTWWTVAGHQLDSALHQGQSLHEWLEQN